MGIFFINYFEDFILKYSKRKEDNNNLIKKSNQYNFEINKIISNHISTIYNVIILIDGRLSSSSEDGYFNIYNKINYNIDFSIFYKNIYYHTQLKNENIIISYNKGIEIIKLSKNNNKYNIIGTILCSNSPNYYTKIIELENNNLILTTSLGQMEIWKKNINKNFGDPLKDCNYEFLKTIKLILNDWQTNILLINNNIIAASTYKTIKFFNIENNFKIIKKIKNIYSTLGTNGMILKENNLIIAGCKKISLYIIDIRTYELTLKICLNKFNSIQSILVLLNGNILIGYQDDKNQNNLIEYKYDVNDAGNLIEVKFKEKAHNQIINGLNQMKNGIIVTYSWDHKIKLWK